MGLFKTLRGVEGCPEVVNRVSCCGQVVWILDFRHYITY